MSPFQIANASSGLCHGGCPANELVDYSSFFVNHIHQNDVSGGDDDGDTYTKLSHYQAMELCTRPVSYTHLRAHETEADLVCRLLLEKKK